MQQNSVNTLLTQNERLLIQKETNDELIRNFLFLLINHITEFIKMILQKSNTIKDSI